MLQLIYSDSADQFPLISSGDIIIDAIFGSGLTKPAEGLAAEVIKLINLSDSTKYQLIFLQDCLVRIIAKIIMIVLLKLIIH